MPAIAATVPSATAVGAVVVLRCGWERLGDDR